MKKGYGVKQDYNKAKEYYELSAQQKNSSAFFYLGNLYYNGYGVKQDYNKAKEYFELSAQQNNSDAFIYLGKCIFLICIKIYLSQYFIYIYDKFYNIYILYYV